MMKLHVIGTALALALVATVPADISYALRAAAQEERVWGGMRGTIKSIDDKVLVMSPSTNNKATATFELSPDVKRTGTLTTGAPISVRFYFDNGKRIVTEVNGKSEK